MRLKRSFKLAWNSFFLLTASCFIFLWVMVLFFGESVNQVGEAHIQNYVSEYKLKSDAALLQLKNNNSQITEELLTTELSEIKKGDRLYPIKRQLMLNLVDFLYAQKSKDSWIKWATVWFELDSKDVTAMAYYYQALLQSEIDYEQGLNGLQQANQQFPQHQLLKQFYHAAIGETQMTDDKRLNERH